jgi:DNA gyrase subunit B
MPELIERGHVLIAQPPLYKVKRGKQEKYIKDEHELTEYVLELALDDAFIIPSEGATPISGADLRNLALSYYEIQEHMKRLDRVYPLLVLKQLPYIRKLDLDELADEATVREWLDLLDQRVQQENLNGAQYIFELSEDQERHQFYPCVAVVNHGIRREYVFDRDFFASADYREFALFGDRMSRVVSKSGIVTKGDKSEPVENLESALDWLQSEAQRGQSRQRFKGLGEMNPSQLWETTMDPETRTMLRVTIEDAIAADQVFTTLMGDQVEPRRQFIEENALAVANLDV